MVSINDFSDYIEINGKKQFLSVCSRDIRLPVLLYLHGGPGDAALPLVKKFNSSLENYYTVAVWEQRGSGKSFYRFSKDDDINIQLFIEDIHKIVEFLLHKYKQDKVYLLGHSWGSVIGLKFVQLYPELIHTYIGCGQVVNMEKSSRIAYEYAIDKCVERNNIKTLGKLKNIDCTYSSEHWFEDLLFVTRQVVKYGGSLYGEKNYYKLVKPFIFSKEYSLIDLINRQKGSMQSIKRLWQELMAVNFEPDTSFSVPIVFIEGKYDYHVSSQVAKSYLDTILTPKKFVWFENSCHFPQWSEASKFTEVLSSIL
ncbi:alpha/beta hydrolase [Tissierella sp. MB52-C2]|uniref:alpha/beta fold hydrolase n=1 Tax=Tissierella sp. MB52-C2 TaxID=3070999 RepID=UPI00280ADEBF|nr:alpha/beta hydrolase [Tissierella sp. MB52-C2]WMM23590.1 alpha/beta hydrolase [Tissierella sp. MB52-C2]